VDAHGIGVGVDGEEESEREINVADPYGHQGGLQMYERVRRAPRNISEQAVTGSVDFSAAQYNKVMQKQYNNGQDGDLMSLTKPTRTRETRGGRETTRRTRNGHGRSRTRASDARAVKSGKIGKGGTRRFTDGNNERGMYAVAMEDEEEEEESCSHHEGGGSERSPSETEDGSETDLEDEKSVETYPAYHNITNSEFARLQKAITSARTKSDFQRLERIIRNGLIPDERQSDAQRKGRESQRPNLMPDLVRMRQISETIQSVYNNLPNMERETTREREREQKKRDRGRKGRRRGNGKGKGKRAKDFMPVLDEEELAGKLNQLSLAAAGVDLDGHGGHGHAHGIAISPINREYISEMEDLEDM